MSDSKGEIKTLRVIAFSGKEADWPFWSKKFLAKARRSGFRDILLGKATVPKEDEDVSADTKKTELRELNEMGFEELLLLSMDINSPAGKVAFNVVDRATSEDLPSGSAVLAWKNLQEKYEGKDAPTRLDLKKEFEEAKLGAKEDPDIWLTYLQNLQTKLRKAGATCTDEDVL